MMILNNYLELLNNRKRITRYITERLRYATPYKLKNFLWAEFMLIKKIKRLSSYPFEAIIDLTNRCNLKCPLCATGSGLNQYKQGIMDISLFSKICGQIAPYVFSVTLYNWGEIFLVKNLPDYLKIIKGHRMGVTLSSNLSVDIKDEVIEGLIKNNIDSLIISCDGITQDIYQKYRRNGDLSQVFRNIKRIQQAKKRLKNSHPRLIWQFLLMRYNQMEAEEARRIYKEVGADEIEFAFINLPFGIFDKNLAREFFVDIEFRNRVSYIISKGDLHAPCWLLWRAITINWDGTVAPCHYVNCDDYGLGDFRKQSLKEIWNSDRYVASRGLFRGEDEEFDLICKQCPIYMMKGLRAK